MGLDGIVELTTKVGGGLSGAEKAQYERLLAEAGPEATVEQVLDTVRLCRELIRRAPERETNGLKGGAAEELDRAICRGIFKLVSVEPAKGLTPHIGFANWVRSVGREHPVEIFTTNYDLLIERALEFAETPHFDGFVGTVNPYFSAISVEAEATKHQGLFYPPRSWVRVWKLHGSIGWRAVNDGKGTMRITRSPAVAPTAAEDLIIFPSQQKYVDSRRLPFVAYHDRFRRLLGTGETLLIAVGYSFRDEHINEVIIEGLRINTRLAVAALLFEPLGAVGPNAKLIDLAPGLPNLALYGPDRACVGGIVGKWTGPSRPAPANLGTWPFWNDTSKEFTLGGFTAFSEFLARFVGTGAAVPAPAEANTATGGQP